MRTTSRVLAVAGLLAAAGSLPARDAGDCLLVRYLTGRVGPSRLRLVELSTGKVLRRYTLPVNENSWLALAKGSLLYEIEGGEVRSLDLRTGRSTPFGRVPARVILHGFSPSGTKAIYLGNAGPSYRVVDLRSGRFFSLGEDVKTASWAPGKDVVLFTEPADGPLSSLDTIAEGPEWRPQKATPSELRAVMGWWWRRVGRQRLERTVWFPSRTGRSALVIQPDGTRADRPAYLIYNRRGRRVRVRMAHAYDRFMAIGWSSSERYLYGRVSGPLIRIDAFTGRKMRLWRLGLWWPVGVVPKP